MAKMERVPWEAKDLIRIAEARLEYGNSWTQPPNREMLYLESVANSLLAIAKLLEEAK